ncbi:proline-rich protein 5-like isoform X8 [Stigmatopora nigra]
MGSFRRPRPRFMSSPVLSDLSRFHAGVGVGAALQVCHGALWNSVQSAVMKVFRGGALRPNELYALNENVRRLLKSEMGAFLSDYFQNRLLAAGLAELLERVYLAGEEERLEAVSRVWRRFFTETLPTLQAIFYPVQGREPSVRQMALLSFRDAVVLQLPLEDSLANGGANGGGAPPDLTHMLLVLQGVRERGPSSDQRYRRLERLAAAVVSPYLADVDSGQLPPSECTGVGGSGSQPDVVSSLTPLLEHEGEAYLEKVGAARRHTVANAHPDVDGI